MEYEGNLFHNRIYTHNAYKKSYQAISWTNVELSCVKYCDICPTYIEIHNAYKNHTKPSAKSMLTYLKLCKVTFAHCMLKILKVSFAKRWLKIIHLKSPRCLGANELIPKISIYLVRFVRPVQWILSNSVVSTAPADGLTQSPLCVLAEYLKCWYISHGSFGVWSQSMRDDVTL